MKRLSKENRSKNGWAEKVHSVGTRIKRLDGLVKKKINQM